MLERFLSKTQFSSYEDLRENYHLNIPDNFNFAYDVVDEYAASDPEKVALVWCDDSGREATFTFREMKLYSDKAANVFRDAGIRRGDKVMLILRRRYQFWFCLLALHKLGAVAIPATHLLSPHDVSYRNNAADIKMIVAVHDDRVAGHVDEAHPDSPSLRVKASVGGPRDGWLDFDRALEGASDHFERPQGDEATDVHDTLLLYFTSGTTGMPKMVCHDHTYPLGHIITAKYWHNLHENSLHCTVADTGWAKCAWGKIYGQWIVGAAVFVCDFDRFDAGMLMRIVEKYKVTSFCAPPTVYRFIIKEDLSKYNFEHLEYCTVAGEPLNPEVFERFYRATGLKIREGFGQTEAIVLLAAFPWVPPRPGSMGKPSPGFNVDVVNGKGESCDAGDEGEIVIRTGDNPPAGMFTGYYRDEALTKSVWHDGVYHTGDMAWRDEDGYYWFVGRADDLIKSSGYRIGPFEVESALIEHPAVLECAVTGVPDPDRGQVVKATVVLVPNYTPGEELVRELQQHVKRVTAPYKYPRIIEFVDELPKTISGKIRRATIREEDSGEPV
ncbi:AMP-binding protein [bacterium]|nr:AMP-binding protein [bacterium]